MAYQVNTINNVQLSNNNNTIVIGSTISAATQSTFFYNTYLSVIDGVGTVSEYSFRTSPNVNDQLLQSFNSIVSGKMSSDVNLYATSFTPATHSILQYKYKIVEDLNGVTYSVATNLNSSYYLMLNGVTSHDRYINWNSGEAYNTATSSSLFLTNAPTSKQFVKEDYETLSFFHLKPTTSTYSNIYAHFNFYNSSNQVVNTEVVANQNTLISTTFSGTISNYVNSRLDAPVGIKNIKTLTSTYSSSFSDEVTHYDVQLYKYTDNVNAGLYDYLDLHFGGSDLPNKHFTIVYTMDEGTATYSQTFTFKASPVTDNELLYEGSFYINEWLNDDILPKIANVFDEFDCFITTADASTGTIRIARVGSTFSIINNDTVNVTGTAVNAFTDTVPNVNLIKGLNKGVCDYVDGATTSNPLVGLWIADGAAIAENKRLAVYCDDFGVNGATVSITIPVQTLIPNASYKLTYYVSDDDLGGSNSTLTTQLQGFSGASSAMYTQTVKPHQVIDKKVEYYFHTATTTTGSIKLLYTVDTTGGGDHIVFYIDNMTLELIGTASPISQKMTYVFGTHNIYDEQRVMFKNSLGSFDFYNFKIVEKNSEVEKESNRHDLPYNYNGRNGRNINIFKSSTTTTTTLNSGLIDTTYNDFFLDLIQSSEVYFITNDTCIPVTCLTTDMTHVTKGIVKPMSYTLNFIEANKNNNNI